MNRLLTSVPSCPKYSGDVQAAAGHGGPREPIEVFFDPERVQAFKASKKWTQPAYAEWDVPPEWLAEAGIEWESKPKEPGRPGEEWHDLIAGAANEEEAAKRLPALPKGMERTFTDATGKRIRISKAKDVSMKHFKDTFRKLRKKSSDE